MPIMLYVSAFGKFLDPTKLQVPKLENKDNNSNYICHGCNIGGHVK